jgi:hypothetical protein
METATIQDAEMDGNSHYKACRDGWKEPLYSVQRWMERATIKDAEMDGNSHYKWCRDRWKQPL